MQTPHTHRVSAIARILPVLACFTHRTLGGATALAVGSTEQLRPSSVSCDSVVESEGESTTRVHEDDDLVVPLYPIATL